MNSSQSRSTVVAIACSLVVYAARTGSAAPLGSAIDPCTLLTPAQIKSAVGIDVGPGKPISATACAWKKPTGRGEMVTVALEPVDTWAKMKLPLAGIEKNTVSGIGDDAFYAIVAQYSTLSVKKGGTVFIVRIYGIDGHDKQESMEKTLAGDVISNGKL